MVPVLWVGLAALLLIAAVVWLVSIAINGQNDRIARDDATVAVREFNRAMDRRESQRRRAARPARGPH